jgi:ATP/maltotriose-dependent transcriptional regulator MalT
MQADASTPLAVDDIERLAVVAYLTGHDDEHATVLERAHVLHQDAGDAVAAARCAFWIALIQMLGGEAAHARGWVARARRLLGDHPCAEQGYLLLPVVESQLHGAAYTAAADTASRALEIGEQFGDRDLVACARHLHGRALLKQGRIDEGLALLDETMIAVFTDALSPVMTGLLYCSVIETCSRAYALDRSADWTAGLSRWCDAQHGLAAFTTACLVRRAEILRLRGQWSEALAEAQRACTRFAHRPDRRPPADALYEQAEVLRLRGEFREAESAYRAASAGGRDPQPGLALLRLAKGDAGRALQTIRRVVTATSDTFERSRLLPALVEIALASDERAEARSAVTELESIATAYGAPTLNAISAQARGQLLLAEGDATAAVSSLRRAGQLWDGLGAPWFAARARLLVGQACQTLGDTDGAALEFQAARDAFAALGAAPDLASVELLRRSAPEATHPLSAREVEVVRLLAAGSTNRTIGTALGISEKTVARHVSNIFSKLGLSSRAAATAWAWRRGMT